RGSRCRRRAGPETAREGPETLARSCAYYCELLACGRVAATVTPPTAAPAAATVTMPTSDPRNGVEAAVAAAAAPPATATSLIAAPASRAIGALTPMTTPEALTTSTTY